MILDEYSKHKNVSREQFFLFIKTIYEWLKEYNLLNEEGNAVLEKIKQGEGSDTFTTQGMSQKGFNYIYMIYCDNMFIKDSKILDINDSTEEIKKKLDKHYPKFCELYDVKGHRIKGINQVNNFSKPIDNKNTDLKKKLEPIVKNYLSKLVREKNQDIGYYLVEDDPSFLPTFNDIPNGKIFRIDDSDDAGCYNSNVYEIGWENKKFNDGLGWWFNIEIDKNTLKPVHAYMQTFSQLTDNIKKGVGEGNFGYGLRKKDGSGLDFTKETKKKLAKEREDFLKGINKYGQFSNTSYDTIIIFRYDGASKWDDNCMSIQLVYENSNWVINDTSVSRVFNKKEVEEMLRHCKNKQKKEAKVLILANENKKLRTILKELGYNPKTLYSILPPSLKSSYPLNHVGEEGYPHPNSQKNMSIDVSFFYKAFGNQSSLQAFSNLFTEASRAIMFRQQIGQLLTANPKKFPPELHKRLVELDKKYMQGNDPIAYLNSLTQREIHRAYLEYKMFWVQVQQWGNTHDAKGNPSNFDFESIRGILMDPDDESKYEGLEDAINGSPLGNKYDQFVDWAREHRKQVAAVGAACFGLLAALQVYSYMIHGHGILYVLFKKFNKWMSARSQMNNAIKGSPLEKEWIALQKNVENAKTPEENKQAVAALTKFAKTLQSKINKQEFSMTYEDELEELFSIKSFLLNPKTVGTVIGTLSAALIATKLARMNAKRINDTKALYAKINETADRFNLVMSDPKHEWLVKQYKNEWDALYKEIKSTPDNDTRLVKQCDERLNAFGEKVVSHLKEALEEAKGRVSQHQQVAALEEIGSKGAIKYRDLDDDGMWVRESNFAISNGLAFVGGIITGIAGAVAINKAISGIKAQMKEDDEYYAKIEESADKIQYIFMKPENKELLKHYKDEWNKLYREVKNTTGRTASREYLERLNKQIADFGEKVIAEVKERAESKFLEVEKYRAFSPRLQSVINFSLITKRDDVLNSLRLVFKEMPKDAPQLEQAFLIIQSKYLKEKMGSYDIEALKPKVQDLNESQLEECNTALRALLKEIRNFNKNPIINKGPRGNKLPKDDDLNKIERLGRDIGKNARNILTPVSLGLGAAIAGRRLLKGN